MLNMQEFAAAAVLPCGHNIVTQFSKSCYKRLQPKQPVPAPEQQLRVRAAFWHGIWVSSAQPDDTLFVQHQTLPFKIMSRFESVATVFPRIMQISQLVLLTLLCLEWR
jgi:hypothetical protein